MSDYTRITNFTAKDALTTGDPEKLVSGQELQAEMDAIAVAIASKGDSGSDPGAAAEVGVDDTDLGFTAADVQAALEALDTGRVIIQVACSDLSTALSTGDGKGYFRAPKAFTLTAVRASVATVSSSGVVTLDVRKNNTTIFSTGLTIDANEKTSVTAATPAVISVTAVADDDLIEIDIDGAGTGTKGLIVTFIGH